MISLRQYYFFAVWLPVIVPIVTIFSLGVLQDNFSFDKVGFFSIIYFFPYITFVLLAINKLGIEEVDKLKKFSIKAPLYFALFYMIAYPFFYSYSVLIKGYVPIQRIYEPIIDSLWMAAITPFVVIPVAYSFVALAHGLSFILKKVGVIKS